MLVSIDKSCLSFVIVVLAYYICGMKDILNKERLTTLYRNYRDFIDLLLYFIVVVLSLAVAVPVLCAVFILICNYTVYALKIVGLVY